MVAVIKAIVTVEMSDLMCSIKPVKKIHVNATWLRSS